jgi:hypothetical protein
MGGCASCVGQGVLTPPITSSRVQPAEAMRGGTYVLHIGCVIHVEVE